MDVERLTYVFGPEVLDVVDRYDLEQESDRLALVEEFLLETPDERARGARAAVRTVAVTQILTDDPPETWRTVKRLRESGLDRDAVLSQLTMLIGERLMDSLDSRSPFDVEEYVAALESLPLPTASEVARVAVDIVRARPGIAADDHFRTIRESLPSHPGAVGPTLVDRVVERLVRGPLHWLPGDLTVHVPDLVDSRTFCHRLVDVESELGVLTASFDLGAFSRFDTVRLADGTEIEQYYLDGHHLAWRGPDGWLAAFEPDDVLSVTATVHAPDGGAELPVGASVRIEVAEPQIGYDVVRAVREGYDELVAEPGLPVTGEDLALWLCFHRRELFAEPQSPLTELCEAAGLVRRGGLVAHDEDIWRRDLFGRRFHEVTSLVPEPHWREVLGTALAVLDDPDSSVDRLRAALDECAEPETLDVLADVLFPHHLSLTEELDADRADSPGRLFDLIARARAVARLPRETATAGYLACVLYERCGAPEIAEQHLADAARAVPRLGPIVERMGWYRFDRGDARGAMRWWRELDEVHPAAATIAPFVTPAGDREPGRNDPCWCGSGRKSKRCHQSSIELPALPDRVVWLCRKASSWLEHSTGDVRDVVVQMATARVTADPDAWGCGSFGDESGEVFAEEWETVFSDPIVFDTALHEGGLFRHFLRDRYPLLPTDEQLLATSWSTVERSVHEVVAVEPGQTLRFRDLVTGEVVDVRYTRTSHVAQVGDRYCARVVPDGASHQIVGGIFPVREGQESAVLDLCADRDGAGLCAWVGDLHRSPRSMVG